MQLHVRGVLKRASPFAGIVLVWYLFMPNISLAKAGIYHSQFYINLQQLQIFVLGLNYKLRTTRSEQLWDECRYETQYHFGHMPYEDRARLGNGNVGNFESYIIDECGPRPTSD